VFEDLKKRVRQLERLHLAKEPLAPLIVRFTSECNRNALPGTTGRLEGDYALPAEFVMIPPGYRGALPAGIPTFEEWSAMSRAS